MWSVGEGRLKVWCTLTKIGDGLVICLGGGDRPHIGSVSISVPYKRKNGFWSVSTSTITLPSHRDDAITRAVSEKVAKVTGMVVVAVGGVHVEDASKSDIEKIIEGAEELAEKVIAELGKRGESVK